MQASDLGEALSSSSNVVTLLAPTDIAWQKLSLATNLNASEILSNGVGLNVVSATLSGCCWICVLRLHRPQTALTSLSPLEPAV